ncbi:MAG: proline iminopeptidase-family hydrolase [Acidobacteriota bacterium]|nr:proline iminopeptidase-family hydrolase [Acidobacteriota bacterium]
MEINQEKVNELMGRAVADFGATLHDGLVVIGEKLGLYKALAERGRSFRLVLALLLIGSAAAADVKTGGSRMIPVDGKYHVWTKRIGSSPVKLLTLHGGPGFPHDYMECFEDFVPQAGIELYFYDQLGVGNSDQPDDLSLWTIDRYREEVEQVRKGLNLEKFYLFGHSWGGMLAIEYALAHQDQLKALVISNMTASIPSYVAYMNELRAKLSDEDRRILDKYESTKDYEAAEYQQVIMGKLYTKHLLRLDPWPEPVDRAFRKLNAKIYNAMQGPNEFVVTGNFKDWDRWSDLPKIKVPTLVIGAVHDEMRPADIRKMGQLIPNSRTVILNGSHLSMYDDQEAYFRELIRFIKDVDRGKFKSDTKK